MRKEVLDHVPGGVPADEEERIETIDVVLGQEYLVIEVPDMVLHVLQGTLVERLGQRLIFLAHLNQYQL